MQAVPVTWELLARTGLDYPGSVKSPNTPGMIINKNGQPVYTSKSVEKGAPIVDYSANPDFGSLLPVSTQSVRSSR